MRLRVGIFFRVIIILGLLQFAVIMVAGREEVTFSKKLGKIQKQ